MKAADETGDAVERIGAAPGGHERRNSAGAGTRQTAVVRVAGDAVLLADFRQNLFQQEARVSVAKRVVFIAAAETALLRGRVPRRHDAGIHEHANGHGHALIRDQIVEDHRHAPTAGLTHHASAVLKNHEAGGLGGIVLGGNINPVIPRGARKNPAGGPTEFGHPSMRHVRLDLRIRAKLILLRIQDKAK